MGAEAARQVTVADNIVLDFTGLFSETPQEKPPATSPVGPFLARGEYRSPTESENPVERHTSGLGSIPAKEPPEIPAKTLLLHTQREKEDYKRTLEAYRHYQENIRKSEELQSAILKGTRAGEDIYGLFLQAVEAISRMTSNSVFRSQIEEDLRTIYGRGLLQTQPLTLELEETQERLRRLLEAEQREQDPDGRRRVAAAVQAHRKRIAELTELIERGSKPPT